MDLVKKSLKKKKATSSLFKQKKNQFKKNMNSYLCF